MEEALAVVFIFGGGAAFLLAISPIGRAIADRIRSRGVGGGSDERVRYLQEGQEALLEEVEGLRQEVGELQERVDFTERLLARNQGRGQLPEAPDVHN